MTELMYLFFMGSVFGWGLECVFRRFCKDNTERKWINPGFLTGPYLPLYGFGICTLFLLAGLEDFLHIENVILSKAVLLLTMAVCMTLLELVAGLIFVEKMKLKLWDYSDKPFNYKGIICLEFSFYWLILASAYRFFVHDLVVRFLNVLTLNLRYLFPLGMIFGIFMVDFGYSVHLATKIRTFAKDNNVLVRYEELKGSIRKYAEERKEKYHFMFAFRSKSTLNEQLKNYLEKSPKIQKIKEIKEKLSLND